MLAQASPLCRVSALSRTAASWAAS
jgi:hypothetical protein